MIIEIPASITFSKFISTKKYRRKSKDRTTVYTTPVKRTVLRISCAKFGKKLKEVEKDKRQVSVKFVKEKSKWIAIISRAHTYDITIGGVQRDKYDPHQAAQLGIDDVLPSEIKTELSEELGKEDNCH